MCETVEQTSKEMKGFWNQLISFFSISGEVSIPKPAIRKVELMIEAIEPPPPFNKIIEEESDRELILKVTAQFGQLHNEGEIDGENGLPESDSLSLTIALKKFHSDCKTVYKRLMSMSKRRMSKVIKYYEYIEERLRLSHDERKRDYELAIAEQLKESIAQLNRLKARTNLVKLKGREKHYEEKEMEAQMTYKGLLAVIYKSQKPIKQIYDRVLGYWGGMIVFLGFETTVNIRSIMAIGEFSNPVNIAMSCGLSMIIIFCAHKAGGSFSVNNKWSQKDKKLFGIPFGIGLSLCILAFILRVTSVNASLLIGISTYVLFGLSIYYSFMHQKNHKLFQAERDITKFAKKKEEKQKEINKIEKKFSEAEKNYIEFYDGQAEQLIRKEKSKLAHFLKDYEASLDELKYYEEELTISTESVLAEGWMIYIQANNKYRKKAGHHENVALFDQPIPPLNDAPEK